MNIFFNFRRTYTQSTSQVSSTSSYDLRIPTYLSIINADFLRALQKKIDSVSVLGVFKEKLSVQTLLKETYRKSEWNVLKVKYKVILLLCQSCHLSLTSKGDNLLKNRELKRR